jgi:hypothetical protein
MYPQGLAKVLPSLHTSALGFYLYVDGEVTPNAPFSTGQTVFGCGSSPVWKYVEIFLNAQLFKVAKDVCYTCVRRMLNMVDGEEELTPTPSMIRRVAPVYLAANF